jgi:hypothetical protein
MRGAADSSGHPQAIIVSDQSFPACLPVAGQEGCLKIILVENGSIKSLFEELVKQVGNRRLPKGSIVLAFSAAHLTNVGLAQYTADLVEMGEAVKNKYGGETHLGPSWSSSCGRTTSTVGTTTWRPPVSWLAALCWS